MQIWETLFYILNKDVQIQLDALTFNTITWTWNEIKFINLIISQTLRLEWNKTIRKLTFHSVAVQVRRIVDFYT